MGSATAFVGIRRGDFVLGVWRILKTCNCAPGCPGDGKVVLVLRRDGAAREIAASAAIASSEILPEATDDELVASVGARVARELEEHPDGGTFAFHEVRSAEGSVVRSRLAAAGFEWVASP